MNNVNIILPNIRLEVASSVASDLQGLLDTYSATTQSVDWSDLVCFLCVSVALKLFTKRTGDANAELIFASRDALLDFDLLAETRRLLSQPAILENLHAAFLIPIQEKQKQQEEFNKQQTQQQTANIEIPTLLSLVTDNSSAQEVLAKILKRIAPFLNIHQQQPLIYLV